MGDNWVVVREVLHNFDYPIIAVILAGIAYYVYRHLKPHRVASSE